MGLGSWSTEEGSEVRGSLSLLLGGPLWDEDLRLPGPFCEPFLFD